jgi:hypothetical protein
VKASRRTDANQRAQREAAAEASRRTDAMLQGLAESQQRMDAALTALMGTVDQIIRSRN